MKYVVVNSTAIRASDVIRDLSTGYESGLVTGALLFIVADLDCAAITRHFDDQFSYAGCTMTAGMSQNEVTRQLAFSETAVLVLFCGDDEMASGYITSFPSDQKRLFAFSINDEALPQHQLNHSMLGGLASPAYDNSSGAVWANGVYSNSGTVALDLPTSTVGLTFGSGWSALDGAGLLAGSVNGSVIWRLNDDSAWALYRSYIDNPRLCGLYPLMRSNGQLLDVVSINEVDGSLTLNQPVNEGELLQVCACSRTDLSASIKVTTAGQFVTRGNEHQLFNMAFSCRSRYLSLGDMSRGEFALLQSYTMKSGQSNVLVYLAGQFIPDAMSTRLVSQTLVIASLFDDTSDRLSDF